MHVQPIAVPPPDELRHADRARLAQQLERLGDIAAQQFTPLSLAQLNWKPAADEWSVGQCLDHIITTDEQYMPIVAQAAQGTLPGNVWQRLPFLPRLCGTMLYRYTHPATTRPTTSPRIFQPSQSDIELDVHARVQTHQAEMLRLLRATDDATLDARIISSPVAAWLVVSLGDAFRVLVAHQYLHLVQAERVMQMAGFPADDAAS